MVAKIEVSSAGIQARIGARTSTITRLVRWVPYVGALIGIADTAVETYVAVSDPSLAPSERLDKGIETASKSAFTWGAVVGVCALGTALVPSAPFIAGGAAVVGIGYAIEATGVSGMVGHKAIEGFHWATGTH